MTTLLPECFGLLLRSTILLALALFALHLTRQHGPAVQSLVGRAALVGIALILVMMPLAGRLPAVWRVTEPTPAHEFAPPPETGGGGDKIATIGHLRAALSVPDAPRIAAPALPVPGGADATNTKEAITHEGAASSAPTPPLRTSSASRFGRGGELVSRGGFLWPLGNAFLLLWLGLCHRHVTCLSRSAHPITSGRAFETLTGLTTRPPRLLCHPAVLSPFLAGTRSPVIFLPVAYETAFDPTALHAIMAHELAHLDRRDNAWTLAARLLCALLWPQPLLWLLCCRLEQIGEEACDAAVLARDCSPRAYADCLLTLAERHPLGHRERALGVGVAPFRSSLGRRVSRILDKGTSASSTISTRLRLTIAALTVATALGGALLVSSAPTQSPGPDKAALTPRQRFLATWTPEQRLLHAEQEKDMMNLNAIGLALSQYIQDHDEFFPNAAHWMDELSPYLKDKTVFYDPFQPGRQRYGYAFNYNCSGKALAAIAHPSDAIAAFDSTLGTRNANDTGQSLQATMLGKVSGSSCLFVDGHVKWIIKPVQPLFGIQWDRRFIHMTPTHPAAGLPAVLYNPPLVISQGSLTARRNFVASTAQSDPKLNQARFLAGLTAVQGPGVIVTLRDSTIKLLKNYPPGITPPNLIHDTDINQVVNELKAAGAEAIAVNDQRLGAISPIRGTGPTIFINNLSQTPPFVIKAIGSSKMLASALNVHSGIAAQIKSFDPSMFSIQEAPKLTLPAYSTGNAPRYAKPVASVSNTDGSQQLTQLQEAQQAVLQAQLAALQKEMNAFQEQAASLTAKTQEMRTEAWQRAQKMSKSDMERGMSDAQKAQLAEAIKAAQKAVADTQSNLAKKGAILPSQNPITEARQEKIRAALAKAQNKLKLLQDNKQFIEGIQERARKAADLSNQMSVKERITWQQDALRKQQNALQLQKRELERSLAALIVHEQGQTPGH